jgi:hypothetical protein
VIILGGVVTMAGGHNSSGMTNVLYHKITYFYSMFSKKKKKKKIVNISIFTGDTVTQVWQNSAGWYLMGDIQDGTYYATALPVESGFIVYGGRDMKGNSH